MEKRINFQRFITIFTIILSLAVIPLLANDNLKAPSEPIPPFKWKVGEELEYKVKYSFLTVGSLHFWILNKEMLNGRPVYHCRMHMKSNSAIPFVSIDDYYESYIDEDVYSHRSEAWEKDGDHILYTRYDMDYAAGKLLIRIEKHFENDTIAVLDSVTTLTEKVQDGFSLLFFARANVQIKSPQDVTVFSFNDYRQTFINFTGMVDEVKAKGTKLDGYYLDGKMKFVGIAGIKEDFQGWFAPESQRVPLHAKMKAFLGSVRLNLESWKNWDADSLVAKD